MSLLKKVTNVFASCWLLYCLFNAFSFVCSGWLNTTNIPLKKRAHDNFILWLAV